MLLPLFFAQVLYPQEWKKYWTYIRPIYGALIIGIVLFQCIWAVMAVIETKKKAQCDYNANYLPPECYHTEYTSGVFRMITAVCFLFLACAQAGYGYMLNYIDKQQYNRFIISSPTSLSIVNTLLVLSFLSRSMYQFGMMFGVLDFPQIPLLGNNDIHFTVLLIFEAWDYIPLILMITTITAKSIGNSSNIQKHLGKIDKSIAIRGEGTYQNYGMIPVEDIAGICYIFIYNTQA